MLSQRQPGMAVVFDDVMAVGHLPKRYLWLPLLRNRRCLAFGRGGKQGQ